MGLKKRLGFEEALEKAKSLCAEEEKCKYDVRKKLFDWGVTSGDTEKIINRLSDETFLDEWRYSRMFASGKFRNNNWGKIKISYELLRKNIARNVIDDALIRIDESEYIETLRKQLHKKLKSISADDDNELKAKLFRYANAKGFESELISEILDELIAVSE